MKFPTRERNTLDVFITNRPSLIQKCKPVQRVSNHDIVFVESSISATRSKPPQRKIFLWKRANYVGMKESVSLASASLVAKNKTSTDINQLWGDFKDMCHQAITHNVPTKMTSTRFSQPWIDRNAKDSPNARKKPIAELNKPTPMRTLRNTRTSRKRPSSTVGKPTTTMLKTLSLEMTASQRSYGPSLKRRSVIVAASPH